MTVGEKMQQRLPWVILSAVALILIGWWATSSAGLLENQADQSGDVSSAARTTEHPDQGSGRPQDGQDRSSSESADSESPSSEPTSGIQQGMANTYVHRQDAEDSSGPLVVEGLSSQGKTAREVALLAASVMTTWAPAEDLNQTEAEKRARGLMTEQRADDVAGPQRPASGKLWRQAATEDATSVPMVELNQATEVQDGTISVIATWSWSDPEGRIIASDPTRRIFYFQITETSSGPRISDYTWEDAPEMRQ